MTLAEIYKNIHTQLSKDGNTGFIPMDRFNSLLPFILYELIRKEAATNNMNLEHGNEELLSLQVLSDLIVFKEDFATSASIALNSSNFTYTPLYFISANTSKNTGHNTTGVVRKIKFVSQKEYNASLTNMMKMNLDENPVCFIHNKVSGSTFYDYLNIYPTSINYIDMIFVKKPSDPFLDYYMDSSHKLYFLTSGQQITISGGSQYRDGTITGTKTSITQELQIPTDYHVKFQDLLLERISLAIDVQYANQFAMSKEQKI